MFFFFCFILAASFALIKIQLIPFSIGSRSVCNINWFRLACCIRVLLFFACAGKCDCIVMYCIFLRAQFLSVQVCKQEVARHGNKAALVRVDDI